MTADQVRYGYAGTSETYGGRRIFFLDGILKDQPGTHWMVDERTGILFSADAFGYLFPAAADRAFDDELDGGIPRDWLRRYHASAFRFLPLVRGERVKADIAKVFAKREIKILAPTHGNAVRGDVVRFVDRFNQAITDICR